MSGSFVETGSCIAQIVTVGSEGYAARINAQAKFEKPVFSEILATIKGIIKFSTCALIPLGIILFLRTWSSTHMYDRAILSTVAAVVAMIPQGLVLLTSSVMAIAATRLAQKHVLVQQMYCIETLARVNCVCLDKTGTITSGAMEVQDVLPGSGVLACEVQKAFTTIAQANADDANETSLALLSYAEGLGVSGLDTRKAIPFSSQRKYSGAIAKDGTNYIMGAAQFILEDPSEIDYLTCQVQDINRILVVGKVSQFTDSGDFEGKVEVLGIVSICDEIRPSASETIKFFADQGVEVKVISGDDPRTVSAISQKVDIVGAECYIDATCLNTDEDIYEAAGSYQVFGRVTPYQKQKLVLALQAQGKVVAMTGDGVNDVLALKSADCSFAMASGSDAARNVAEVVLADNDFSHMPQIVYEGRRSINNLQRTASLFLVKTIFSVLLAALCIVVPPYPFIPIQMSFFSGLLIGMPSFVLALEPNHDRVEGDFLTKVLSCSLPASLTMLALVIPTIIVRGVLGLDFHVVSTVCTMAISSVGIFLIYKLSIPFSLLRKCLFITVITFVVGGMVVFGEIFRFVVLDIPVLVYTIALVCIGKFGFDWLYELSSTHPEFVARLFSGLVKMFGPKHRAKH